MEDLEEEMKGQEIYRIEDAMDVVRKVILKEIVLEVFQYLEDQEAGLENQRAERKDIEREAIHHLVLAEAKVEVRVDEDGAKYEISQKR